MAVEVLFQAPTPALVARLVESMRIEDQVEVMRAGCASPAHALETSLAVSDMALLCTFDGEPAAVFGVQVTRSAGVLGPPLEGEVWALTGMVVDAYPFAFMAYSRLVLNALLEWCPVLHNCIDAEYTKALRWARWLGVATGEPVPLGPYGFPFVPFEVRR